MDTKSGLTNIQLPITNNQFSMIQKVNPISKYKYGFKKPENFVFKSKKGLSFKVITDISAQKKEPDWMRQFRINALKIFFSKKLPTWGPDLSKISFNNIYYYVKPTDRKAKTWEDLPKAIKDTYDKIGVPQAEKKFLGGVSAQYESEVVYKSIQKTLSAKGVIFLDMDSALEKFPQLVQEYFGTLVSPMDNKFAALNSAAWSGGSFIYVPKGVKIELPLQAYFRINAANFGQFERTLIIADEDSFVHYVEGCTAPIYTTDSLHCGVVEIFVKKDARVRYTTIQNWSTNVYNLVTKRMLIESNGVGEWIDGNIGSKVTMKYPAVILNGEGAKGEIVSITYANKNQIQDAGGKAIHKAAFTSSKISSKSISLEGGRTSYRGLIHMSPKARNSKSHVQCDALILDNKSRSDTYPTMNIQSDKTVCEHEASISKISEEQLFYLQSRGLTNDDAKGLIVNGFIEPFIKELPLEYAVELNRLLRLEMKGSVG